MSIFSGKHVAIVGATGAIGSAIARAFAAQGAVITVFGRAPKPGPQGVDLYQAKMQQVGLSAYKPQKLQQDGNGRKKELGENPSGHQFVPLDILSNESIFRQRNG